MDYYIDKFERVVDLLRETGSYVATLVSGNLYSIDSSVAHTLAVKDYVSLGSGVHVRVVSVTSSKVFVVDSRGLVIEVTGTWKALAPYSDYGTRKTINTKLLEKNGGEFAYQKYPLIALRLPVVITTADAVSSMDMNVIIATFTKKQYKPQERIANTFKPVLYPLTRRFLDMLRRSGEFMGYDKNHDWIDRMFYGTESGDESNIANVFDDPLDAVELRNLKLTFIVDDCPVPAIAQIAEGGFEYGFEHLFES